ncbi:unnamed protein product, partial [marine sediment metagenome]
NVRSFIYSLFYISSLNNNLAKSDLLITELSDEIDGSELRKQKFS